ncbi:MAG: NAD(P)(+) transhydrogenase (Re/Si-specific) subunit beta, partial [Planctomycetota bacterium]
MGDFEGIRNVLYLLSAVMFYFGIRGLTHPRTAVRGNLIGALAMLLAASVTVIDQGFGTAGWILIAVGIIVGGIVGVVLAVRIQMTGMPQLVALFNGFGGLASFLVAGAVLHLELHKDVSAQTAMDLAEAGAAAATAGGLSLQTMIATAASGLIGAVTFSGSVLAFAKLQELISGNPVTHPGLKIGNAAGALVAILLS